jgi:hypothetical protein
MDWYRLRQLPDHPRQRADRYEHLEEHEETERESEQPPTTWTALDLVVHG